MKNLSKHLRGDAMKKLPLVLLILLAGCAHSAPLGGHSESNSVCYSVELPQGWMKWKSDQSLLATRDGLRLQFVQITRVAVAREPVKNGKKKLSKGMLPQELAEVVLHALASDQTISHFEVLEIREVEICGIPGFRAVYMFKDWRLKLKAVCYGFLSGESFFAMRYTAALRYYFDKDIETFEKIVESFRLLPPPGSEHLGIGFLHDRLGDRLQRGVVLE